MKTMPGGVPASRKSDIRYWWYKNQPVEVDRIALTYVILHYPGQEPFVITGKAVSDLV